jgi:hypothetical protein
MKETPQQFKKSFILTMDPKYYATHQIHMSFDQKSLDPVALPHNQNTNKYHIEVHTKHHNL